MELQLINSADGAQNGTLDVSDDIFGAEFNESLVHQVVVAHMNGARQGTKAQKNRAAVRGGGAKPWRQKGTGRARAGTTRSPIWRTGGRAFAAQPRDYSQKVNRKMYRAAIRSILAELNRENRLLIVDGFSVEAPKTKELVAKLNALGVNDALVVTEAVDEYLYLASRNLYKVGTCDADAIDPVSLIGFEKVVMTAGALKQIEEKLA